MKKGFTLIELLAVIVILAIVSIIVSPVISGVVNNTKKASAERSIEGYIKSIEVAQLQYQYKHSGNLATNVEDLNINASNKDNINTLNITFKKSGIVENGTFRIDNYNCSYENGSASCIVRVVSNSQLTYGVLDTIKLDVGDGNNIDWTIIDETDEKYILMSSDPLISNYLYDDYVEPKFESDDEMYEYIANIYASLNEEFGFNCAEYNGELSGIFEMYGVMKDLFSNNVYPSVLKSLNSLTSTWHIPTLNYSYQNSQFGQSSYNSYLSVDGNAKIVLENGEEVNIEGITKARLLTKEEMSKYINNLFNKNGLSTDLLSEVNLKNYLTSNITKLNSKIKEYGLVITQQLYDNFSYLQGIECETNNYDCRLYQEIINNGISVGDSLFFNLHGDIIKLGNASTAEEIMQQLLPIIMVSQQCDDSEISNYIILFYSIFPKLFEIEYDYENLLLVYSFASSILEDSNESTQLISTVLNKYSTMSTYNDISLLFYPLNVAFDLTGDYPSTPLYPVIEIPKSISEEGKIDIGNNEELTVVTEIDENSLVVKIKNNNTINDDKDINFSEQNKYISEYRIVSEIIDSYTISSNDYYYFAKNYSSDLSMGYLYVYKFAYGDNFVSIYHSGESGYLKSEYCNANYEKLNYADSSSCINNSTVYFQLSAQANGKVNTNPVYRYISTNENGTLKVEKFSLEAVKETSNGDGLFKDNISNTLYFRGKVNNNYVKFANKTWRIVGVNNDGSVRLILNDALDEIKFNNSKDNNAYLGYMYGLIDSYTYADTHFNTNNSNIKDYLDNWYSNNLLSFSSYIYDSGFINDRSLYNKNGYVKNPDIGKLLRDYDVESGTIDSGKGYGVNDTAYGVAFRLNVTDRPTHMANSINDVFTVSNARGNKKLTYPIGLLTADEMIFAGATVKETNQDYYLYLSEKPFWTMSPVLFNSDDDNNYSAQIAIGNVGLDVANVNQSFYVRPVINIKGNVTVTGNGTSSSPYTVVTNN